MKSSISLFMSYVHTTVNEMSKVYLAIERRYNYTTPKTFLEQIKLYQNLLARKRMELVAKIERLENGLMKLQSTASQVGRGARPEAPPGWWPPAARGVSPTGQVLHEIGRLWSLPVGDVSPALGTGPAERRLESFPRRGSLGGRLAQPRCRPTTREARLQGQHGW